MNDHYERVAALRPANTDEAKLYAIPEGWDFVGLINICNQDSSARTFRVALTDADDAATGEDWIAYDESIAANSRISIKMFMGDEQTVRVKASAADVLSFILSGLLIDNR